MVKDDERYQECGLKGLGVNVKHAWVKVLQKSNSSTSGVKTVYKKVFEAVEELISSLGNTETRLIANLLIDPSICLV